MPGSGRPPEPEGVYTRTGTDRPSSTPGTTVSAIASGIGGSYGGCRAMNAENSLRASATSEASNCGMAATSGAISGSKSYGTWLTVRQGLTDCQHRGRLRATRASTRRTGGVRSDRTAGRGDRRGVGSGRGGLDARDRCAVGQGQRRRPPRSACPTRRSASRWWPTSRTRSPRGSSPALPTAIQGFAKYINKHGGLAGRKLAVDFIDSHLSPTTRATRSSPACEQDFAIVGTAALFLNNVDDMIECTDQAGKATGLPDIPILTTEIAHQCSPVSFGPNPPQLDCATKDAVPQTWRANIGRGEVTTNRSSGRSCTARTCTGTT